LTIVLFIHWLFLLLLTTV